MNPDQMKDMVNNRVIELNNMEQQQQIAFNTAQKQMNDAQANILAIQGAKQDCNYWLTQLAGLAGLPSVVLPPIPGAKKDDSNDDNNSSGASGTGAAEGSNTGSGTAAAASGVSPESVH